MTTLYGFGLFFGGMFVGAVLLALYCALILGSECDKNMREE